METVKCEPAFFVVTERVALVVVIGVTYTGAVSVTRVASTVMLVCPADIVAVPENADEPMKS